MSMTSTLKNYAKTSDFYTKSTKARTNTTEMLSCITLSKLDSSKGTSESLILNWQDQTRLYESLVKTGSHLPNNLKKHLRIQ